MGCGASRPERLAARAAGRSFPHDEAGRSERRRALLSLVTELGARLRTEGQACRSLAATVRYAEGAAHRLSFGPTDERARRIEEGADRDRAKFGPRAVLPGSLAA